MGKVRRTGKGSYFEMNGVFNCFYRMARKRLFDWEGDVPLRVVGYATLTMRDIPDMYRKRVDSAIRRGYLLESRTPTPAFMELALEGSSDPVPIGYVGKQSGYIWLPSEEECDDAEKSAIAMNTMLDEVEDNRLRIRKYSDYPRTECWFGDKFRRRVIAAKGSSFMLEADALFDDGSEAPQLKHCVKGIRNAFDRALDPHAKRRAAVADEIARDDFTVAIPFDSFEGNFSKRRKS